MRDVVIVSGVRTAVGDFLGTLSNFTPIELGLFAFKEAVKRAGIDPKIIEEVVAGQCYQAGSPGNVARHIALKGGCDFSSVAMTVNQQCPSSMRATEIITQEIMLGKIDVGASVGTESMTNTPHILMKARKGYRMGDGELVDTLLYNALRCGLINDHMGVTAENVAKKYGITREEQDELSVLSHARATKAIAEGTFKDEIVPVEIVSKKGTKIFDTDEHVRADVSMESLAKLRPAFIKDGTVTAGNSSGVCDGSASLVLMAADKAKELGVKPMARVLATASAGVDPAIMGVGVVPAVTKALKYAGLTKDDIGYWELNEAFAAQFLGVNKELQLDMEKVNANGSGISIGHPVGCTGARIIVALMYEMKRRGVKYGCAALCAGGGPAAAFVIESI